MGITTCRTCEIPEAIGVAHVAAQGVDRLVPADVHHLEEASTGGRGGEEIGTEAMPGKCARIEPEALGTLGISLDDQGDVLRRQPTWKQSAALANLPENWPFDDQLSPSPP